MPWECDMSPRSVLRMCASPGEAEGRRLRRPPRRRTRREGDMSPPLPLLVLVLVVPSSSRAGWQWRRAPLACGRGRCLLFYFVCSFVFQCVPLRFSLARTPPAMSGEAWL